MSELRRALDRESIVKSNLIEQLIEVVKELQLKFASGRENLTEASDILTNFIWTLEAIFIHGLRNHFLKSTFSSLLRRTEVVAPSFWEFLLVFCHPEAIDEVSRLPLLTTDVGRSRAWLRLALNDGLLLSHIHLMLKEKKTLAAYYKPTAFLRDPDYADLFKSYLYGIENYSFSFPLNSSVLNTWNSYPLSLVGLHMGEMRPSIGLDVAANMETKDLQAMSKLRQGNSRTPPPSFAQHHQCKTPLLEEEEALKVILASKFDSSPNQNSPFSSRDSSRRNSPPEKSLAGTSPRPPLAQEMKELPKNENVEQFSWKVENENLSRNEVSENQTETERDKGGIEIQRGAEVVDENMSYLDLFNEENRMGTPILFQGIFPLNNEEEELTTSEAGGSSEQVDSTEPKIEDEEDSSFYEKIENESGLDSQAFKCKGCSRPIGFIYGDPLICELTGGSYCPECHVGEESEIPSRILLNWDFNHYKVSCESAARIRSITQKPIFDLNVINPKLYLIVEECSELLKLRTQVQSIAKYLITCKGSTIEDVKKELWPREHLYKQIHTYSLSDLLNIPKRGLEGSLKKVVTLGRNHIKQCLICQQKGFLCEICKDPKVIFPFDLVTTFKCSSCGAVYHKTCMNASTPCPRCQRWKNDI